MKKSIKATVSLTVGKAMKLGLDFNPLKNEFFALIKNITHDADEDTYEGIIKYQGKMLKVSAFQDTDDWTIEGLAK